MQAKTDRKGSTSAVAKLYIESPAISVHTVGRSIDAMQAQAGKHMDILHDTWPSLVYMILTIANIMCT